jgi:hypothetical protein
MLHTSKGAAAASVAVLAACSSASSDAPAVCPGVVQQAIVNGTTQETYLGLSAAQMGAIVQVVDSTQPTNGALCSGTLVAPSWVMTAGHCLQIASPAIVVQANPDLPAATLPVVDHVLHPTLDVVLMRVAGSTDDASHADGGISVVAPIAPWAADPPLAQNDVVELAGYGLDESRLTHGLRFATESIVGVDDTTITVSGFGANGACEGDSGGPLLARASDGSPVVAGVLTAGSATCKDEDTYVRIDAVATWLQTVVGSSLPPDLDCGTLPTQGRCLYGSALWCNGAELRGEACAVPTRCGWDVGAAGFRCVSPSSDPCDGVDSIGACRSGVAFWCRAGALAEQPCGACEGCRVNGKTGGAECVPR